MAWTPSPRSISTGRKLLAADNMFRQWRVDAKPLLKRGDNVLEVRIASPIKKIQPWLSKQPYALPGAYDSAFGDEAGGAAQLHLRAQGAVQLRLGLGPAHRHRRHLAGRAPGGLGRPAPWTACASRSSAWTPTRRSCWRNCRWQAGRSGEVQLDLDVLGPDGPARRPVQPARGRSTRAPTP